MTKSRSFAARGGGSRGRGGGGGGGIDNVNPQEAPASSSSPFPPGSSGGKDRSRKDDYNNNNSNNNNRRRLPACVYDLFLDLPHPGGSASPDYAARMIDPPVEMMPASLSSEMCRPESVFRLSRLAFPEYDDRDRVGGAQSQSQLLQQQQQQSGAGGVGVGVGGGRTTTKAGALTSRGLALGANLTGNDVYLVDFAPHHHTFSLLLSDGTTRVHGHVRRYLPPHADSHSRADVGRRGPRAMVLLTRAVGGERFYASVLKTAEAIRVESRVGGRGAHGSRRDPVRSFLHSLFNRHAALITRYAELRRVGLGLNFAAPPPQPDPSLDGGVSPAYSACDAARRVMEENRDLFRIALDRVEFGGVGGNGGGGGGGGEGGAVNQKKRAGGLAGSANNEAGGATTANAPSGGGGGGGSACIKTVASRDALRFHLPPTLQPGFECLPAESMPEDVACPIMPLLRYIGPSHFVRLLSALMCERRIVLISKSAARLSACVRGASSALAQGLLAWKHVIIPVMPPRMLKFLSVDAPYLVGILHPYASRLGKIEGLADVLCVNLDKNELKTLNMPDPRVTVPDMLKRGKSRGEPEPHAAETLARDLDEIMKADQILWDHDERGGGGASGGGGGGAGGLTLKDSFVRRGMEASADAIDERVEPGGVGAGAGPRVGSFLERMKTPLRGRVLNHVQKKLHNMSLEEKREYAGSVDAAVAFGRMIRSTFQGEVEKNEGGGTNVEDEASEQKLAPRYAAPSHDNIGSIDPCAVSENEGGDEDVRAALTCFFIHTYGDMGMYLSETQGTFWLDRRKFLLRKKQLGEKENSPTFLVLQKLSASSMFACHVKGRIDDMSLTARERSNIMPHHIPLFDICSKYLSVHRLDFSLLNIRRIVAKTVLACVRHMAVESHIETRTMALALTAETSFDGNASQAMSELIDSCRECNTHLNVVFSVIWHRLNQTKTSMCILMALHMLKNLISKGPLTAITEALDGAGKIYELKTYSAKSHDANREVRLAADHVYGMLVDLPSLFSRRRQIAASKAQQLTAVPTNQKMWADYLVGRLPFTVEARKLHALFRPHGSGLTYYHADAISVPPSVAASNAPSIMALARMRLSGPKASALYLDESDRLFGSANHDLDGRSVQGYTMPWEAHAEEWSSSESDNDGEETVEEEVYPAEELVSELVQPPLPTVDDLASYDNSTDMLTLFNNAVSSHGGSVRSISLAGTSQFGSERSGSPPHHYNRGAMTTGGTKYGARFIR